MLGVDIRYRDARVYQGVVIDAVHTAAEDGKLVVVLVIVNPFISECLSHATNTHQKQE